MKHITRGDIRVGISGWRYIPWRGSFYSEKLVQKRELYYASRTVNSIEINGSFYAFQTPKSYTSWYSETPENFIFSVKGPRLITHLKRLHEVEISIADFFASGILELDEKLGVILWQFPPSFKFNPAQFEYFLKLLPRTTHEAITCAQHSDAVHHYKTIKQITDKPLRYSIEIRNESFRTKEFIELLRAFNAALVIADTAGRWPQMEDITSNFVYMRCMATRNCTEAVIQMMHFNTGTNALISGAKARSQKTQNSLPSPLKQHASHAIFTVTLIIQTSSGHLMMRAKFWKNLI